MKDEAGVCVAVRRCCGITKGGMAAESCTRWSPLIFVAFHRKTQLVSDLNLNRQGASTSPLARTDLHHNNQTSLLLSWQLRPLVCSVGERKAVNVREQWPN